MDKAQVALGKVLLGGERMCNTTPLGLAPLPETETISLWDWSPYPDKAFSGAVAKAQMMPLSQGVAGVGCVSARDRASAHTHSSFPESEHPSQGGIPL